MTICFVSNYINHHQIPFCEEMIRLCREGDSFFFIQTQEMEEERRLFYVAITWAKDEVQILGCASPSRFLRELFFVEKKGKAGKASSAIEISPGCSPRVSPRITLLQH